MSREKFNLSSKNYYSQKENHQQVYVWHISSLWTGVEEQLCNQKEKEKYEDIEKLSVFCFNRKQIKDLQTSFGKLHRVGTEQGSTAKPVYFMPEASGLVGSKGLKQKNQVIWIAEDGVVYEEPSDFLNPSDISDTSDSSDVSVITDAKDLKKKKKKKIR
ncbi:unnamed protein product [Rhizophagus irregularis]|nr:unnamed protein product [Rhizophagus irregularis]